VVRDAEMKAFVAERYQKAWGMYFGAKSQAIVRDEPQSAQGRILRSAKYLAEHIAEVPVMIFCCVKRYTDPGRAGQPMVSAMYPAIQNLCLAARGYGLGTSITGLHTRFGAEIDARLGVPSEYADIALIPIGYPKGRWDRPARKPALEVMFWEKWGNSADHVQE
jgi:nitroreductase